MTPIDRAMALAYRTTSKLAGITVTYHVGNDAVEVIATGDVLNARANRNEHVKLNYRERAWSIAVCDLAINGEQITPAKGHKIKVVNGPEIEVYEVLTPEGANQCWSYADSGHMQFKIHTIREKSEAN